MYLVTFHHSVLEAPLLHVSSLHFLSASSSVKHEQRNGSFFRGRATTSVFLLLQFIKSKQPSGGWKSSECSDITFIVFIVVGSHTNDSRLLQNNHTHTPLHRSDRSLWLGILLFERDTSGLQWFINLVYCCLLSNFCYITIFISVIVPIDC